MANTEQLEEKIFDVEGVRIVIRASNDQTFSDYPYTNKAQSSTSVTDWIKTRIKPIVGQCEVKVINGKGKSPHGNTSMDTLRNSYKD